MSGSWELSISKSEFSRVNRSLTRYFRKRVPWKEPQDLVATTWLRITKSYAGKCPLLPFAYIVAATELQGIRDDLNRMASAGTLLVTQYTELSLGQLEQVCACQDALGHADHCKLHDAAAVHRCLAGLLADHELAVTQYLDCAVPALTGHGECLRTVTDCDPERFAACEAERAQAMGACPPLAPTLETAFAGCTRGD